MSGGYTNKTNPYLATFSFREEKMAPPYKIWVPQFNRGCQDLMQDKCDQLVEQGVLVDAKEYGIDIRYVSPCFIQQKGPAKHKKLEECTRVRREQALHRRDTPLSSPPLPNRSRSA